MAFHTFSRLEDNNPVKLTLLEYFLSFDGPLLDPDEKDIESADFNFLRDGWSRKGIPWLEGNNPREQNLFKVHVCNVLSVDRYFHTEGLKILLGKLRVAFTFSVGLGSGLRFIDHVRWSSEIALGSKEGTSFLNMQLRPLLNARPLQQALEHRIHKDGGLREFRGEFRSIAVERQEASHRQRNPYSLFHPDLSEFMLPKPRDSAKGPTILAYNNLAHVEIRWICSRFMPVDGARGEREWKSCTVDDLCQVLSYLELQLLAYPRAKTLAIDFIGWDYPADRHPLVGVRIEQSDGEPLTRMSGRLPEIIIRGLKGQQQEKVVKLVSEFIDSNGRVGTTNSHFRLAEGGTLEEVAHDDVVWKKMEQNHTLLDTETTFP